MASTLFVQELRPASPLQDYVHEFKGYGMHPSKCRVRVFTDVPAYSVGQNRWIAIFTDLGEGTSVTNAADQIATHVLGTLPLGESDLSKLFSNAKDADVQLALQLATVRGGFVSFIEHYEQTKDRPFPETFSRVAFSAFDPCGPYYARGPHGYGFSGTSWRHIERSEVERLIGGRFE